MQDKRVYSITYLGPVLYYHHLLNEDVIVLEKHESWTRQSYRNRCYIDSPNGKLMLNIPVRHDTHQTGIENVEVSYTENWHVKHWQALTTTYGSSPFFEILGEDLKNILYRKIPGLFDLNLTLMQFVFDWLQADPDMRFTGKWEPDLKVGDMRETFHPKKENSPGLRPYPQVFDHKHGFLPNLSVVDLLFNEGPAAWTYLKNL